MKDAKDVVEAALALLPSGDRNEMAAACEGLSVVSAAWPEHGRVIALEGPEGGCVVVAASPETGAVGVVSDGRGATLVRPGDHGHAAMVLLAACT